MKEEYKMPPEYLKALKDIFTTKNFFDNLTESDQKVFTEILQECEDDIKGGSKINAIKRWRSDFFDTTGEDVSLRDSKTLIDCMADIMYRRDTITEKLLNLRTRIEDWCNVNSYDDMDNQTERKNEDGEIIWRHSDWDFVDDAYGNMVNDKGWYPHPDSMKKFNELWKRYKLYPYQTRFKMENSK